MMIPPMEMTSERERIMEIKREEIKTIRIEVNLHRDRREESEMGMGNIWWI